MWLVLQSVIWFFLKASVFEVVCALYRIAKLHLAQRAASFIILCLIMQAMDHLESFIAECDRRTELAKKRLAETQEEISAEVSAKVLASHWTLVLKVSVGALGSVSLTLVILGRKAPQRIWGFQSSSPNGCFSHSGDKEHHGLWKRLL